MGNESEDHRTLLATPAAQQTPVPAAASGVGLTSRYPHLPLRVSEPEDRHSPTGSIMVFDAANNDIAEFLHSDQATVGQTYEQALVLANTFVAALAPDPAIPGPGAGDGIGAWAPITDETRQISPIIAWPLVLEGGPTMTVAHWYVHPNVQGWTTDEIDCNDYDFNPTHYWDSAATRPAQPAATPGATFPDDPTPEMEKAFEQAYWAKQSDISSPTPTEHPDDGGGAFGYGYRAMRKAAPVAVIASAPEQGVGSFERVRHVKRGTEYEVLGEAEAQVSIAVDYSRRDLPARLAYDGCLLTIYRCLTTGKLWCRFTDEFRDGRFVPATPHGEA